MSYSFKKLNKASSPTTTVSGVSFYKLSETVTPSVDPYLTFSSPNSFTLKVNNNTKYWDGTLEYSIDASNWNTWDGTTTISSSNDGKMYLRGTGNTRLNRNTAQSNNSRWVFTGSDISCYGNIETLLDYATVVNGGHPGMAEGAFRDLFASTPLVTGPDLGAETATSNCYRQMFYQCTSLTKACKMNLTSLASYCCYVMYSGCTSLTEAYDLNIETGADGCYGYMFQNTGLIRTPKIMLKTGGVDTMMCMFLGCSELITLPHLYITQMLNFTYGSLVQNCPKIKVSETQTGEYVNAYEIPVGLNGTATQYSLNNMFVGTGGTFTGTPTVNTTYYTSNEIV